ncbi:MAG: glycosyltransferase family 39 protein [Anaerolineales bacterium]|nr:glycosyltransferase family 39 protein [Anaerolineales bacterium]
MTFWRTLGNFWRRNTENWIKIALLLILVLAAFLRFYRLDAQSLWADEGNSVSLSGRSLDLITAGAAHDIHPPIYYYLLHFWMRVFGNSEFAVRSLSALLGTGLVYLTYLLGRQLSRPPSVPPNPSTLLRAGSGGEASYNHWLGLVAVFLSAISPFQVYYSQEARMYILLAALSALSVYSFIRFLETEAPKPRNPKPQTRNQYLWAGLYIVATTLSLYTHYSFPIIMVMENLLYGIWLAISWRQGRVIGRVLRWVIIQLAVVALYWPWLPTAFRQVSNWPSISQPHGLLFVVQEAFRLFSLGPTAGVEYTSLLLLGFAAIFIAGVWPRIRLTSEHKSFSPRLLIYLLPLFYCLFPVLMMYALSLWRPAYRPKFFLVGSPAFSLILAQGIVRLSEAAGKRITTRYLLPAICLVFITVASNTSLQNYYFDPQYARDDYRGIAQYISALEKNGDVVLLNAPNQWEIFTYYYKGDAPVYPLPRSRPLDEAQTAEELTEIAAEHNRIFAVLWAVDESDPGRFVEGWLADRAYKALDTWYGNVRLAIYAAPTAPPEEIHNPLDSRLGDEIALLGYNLLTREVEAGDILPLTLFWQALAQPQERYKVFVHILDEAGHIVGQQDSEPGDGMHITTIWRPGETVADNYGVLVRPGTPPGQHRIEVGMYSPISGQRLPISEGGQARGDYLPLDSIEVLRPPRPPSLTALKMQHEVGIKYDDLTLLGYNLYKLGHEHQPTEPIHPGDVVRLDLYWRAFRVPQDDWGLTLQLVDSKGNILATKQVGPASVDYPTTDWELGEVVQGQYDIFIPPEAPKGSYRLTGQLARLPDGQVLRSPWVSQQFLIQ